MSIVFVRSCMISIRPPNISRPLQSLSKLSSVSRRSCLSISKMPSTQSNLNNNDQRTSQEKIESIKKAIKNYPDFPKKGILFRDFFPIFKDPLLLNTMIQLLVDHIKETSPQVEVIIGLESRGFLIGPMIAVALNLPFVPIRKAGKLPGKVKSIKYELEYSTDTFEIQMDSLKEGNKCILVDDLLATGGSLKSACALVQSCKCVVVQAMVVIELADLKGREKLQGLNTYSLIKF